MDLPLRPIAPDEFPEFMNCQGLAFGYDNTAEAVEARRPIMEYDRTLAVVDGSTVAGTAAIFSREMLVPGGASLPCAAVTMVSVRPTHRRQGLLTAMMRRQLEDVRDRGEPLAALWASESVIYGRFGYGLATHGQRFTIERRHAAFARPIRPGGQLRLVEPAEALERFPGIYDAAGRERPGWLSRPASWWENRQLADPPQWREGATAQRLVAYEEEGRLLGYLIYRIRGDRNPDWIPAGTAVVQEHMALTTTAAQALWQHAFDLDLTAHIEATTRPIDEPLYWQLADPRRLRRVPRDDIWLRLTDIPRALESRQYAGEGRLVLAVDDALLPGCGGTFALEVDGGSARCKPAPGETPSLRTSTGTLAALYLGGVSAVTLSAAGLIEGDSIAVAGAARLFSWPIAPWCADHF